MTRILHSVISWWHIEGMRAGFVDTEQLLRSLKISDRTAYNLFFKFRVEILKNPSIYNTTSKFAAYPHSAYWLLLALWMWTNSSSCSLPAQEGHFRLFILILRTFAIKRTFLRLEVGTCALFQTKRFRTQNRIKYHSPPQKCHKSFLDDKHEPSNWVSKGL